MIAYLKGEIIDGQKISVTLENNELKFEVD